MIRFKVHQIASLTSRRCTNVDFLVLLVSIFQFIFSERTGMQSLGCIHFYPNLQGNPTGRQAPIPVVCGFPPCLSLPSGPLPHRNRAAPQGPMKNGSSKDSITKNPWQFKREWEAPHHEPTEAFDVFQNVFFFSRNAIENIFKSSASSAPDILK